MQFLCKINFCLKKKQKNCAVMLQAGVSHNSWGSVRLYVSSVLPVYGPTEKEREGRHIN